MPALRTRTIKRRTHRAIGILAAFCCWAESGAQEPVQDLALFFSATYSDFSGIPDDRFEALEFTPAADAIFSRSAGKRRMMIEYFVNDEEYELERFHFGWQLTEDTRVLLGRFHHSATFWNTLYHHGAYLQQAIMRPSIEEFEDFGGILPMHVTGVLLDQRETFDNGSTLELSFSAGLTNRFEGDELKPFDLLDPRSGHEPAVNARISFLPDALGESRISITFGKHNLPIDMEAPIQGFWDPSANEVELETVGLSGYWSSASWRVFGSSTSVSASARGGRDDGNRDFVASYVQAELDLSEKFSIHFRAENTSGDESYPELFHQYVRRQVVGGARWNVARNHAVTFELADGDSRGDDFRRASVQWSYVLR